MIRPIFMLKRIRSEVFFFVASFLVALYFWIVRRTNFLIIDPPQKFHEPIDQNGTIIFALWHGEHFLCPYLYRRGDKMSVLVSTHRDGEIVARTGFYAGFKAIRGSGDHGREFVRKKALQAFATMVNCLQEGSSSIILTADVPKVSRVAGLGIVKLAKHSQRPIVPAAIATSRRRRLANWDRTCISLPFGRMVIARGEPIFVSPDADGDELEAARLAVQASLDAVTERAYALADRIQSDAVNSAASSAPGRG
jgi:lysophospholipid acyltransferase (LPLAT)-like uncharacterized protein